MGELDFIDYFFAQPTTDHRTWFAGASNTSPKRPDEYRTHASAYLKTHNETLFVAPPGGLRASRDGTIIPLILSHPEAWRGHAHEFEELLNQLRSSMTLFTFARELLRTDGIPAIPPGCNHHSFRHPKSRLRSGIRGLGQTSRTAGNMGRTSPTRNGEL